MLYITLLLENADHGIHLKIYLSSHLNPSEKQISFFLLFLKFQNLTRSFQTHSQLLYHFQVLVIHHH